jgi:cystathionine beta-lyase/cystathionine gamma-synthase
MSTSDNKKDMRFETRAIHAGRVPEDKTGSVTTPIFPSSTYRVEYPGDNSGYVYSRSANPTRNALERAIADLENGAAGSAFSSGLSAVSTVMNLFKTGDHVVASSDLYGGTHRQFSQVLQKFGLEFSFVDGRDSEDFKKALKDNTKLFWIETPSNPLMHLIDIKEVGAIAHQHDILLAVDNTFATPFIQKPLNLGADIAMHSASKYLGGHCDLIAGALVAKNAELGERIGFLQNALGNMLNPFESWLILRGLKSLHVRMERHAYNAKKVAEYLGTVDLVDGVYFPGHDGKLLPNEMTLPGGMVSFELKADFEMVKKFVMATKVFTLAESLGGVESLINHPASMTHASIPPDIRAKHGIRDSLIRLSIGLENIDDILADLQSAFEVVK